MSFKIINIREIIYSVGNLAQVKSFFVDYGGWNVVGEYETDSNAISFWGLDEKVQGKEILIQSNHVENGQIRLLDFQNVEKKHIRSSQQPWDIGGIMDINLRVHEVEQSFEELRELGLHGLSDPLLQVMGPFKLYDMLMKSFDDTIIAFTHRLEPPMELSAKIKFPTHVYKTSITVDDLEASKDFYVSQLGCKVLTEYEVRKDSPQENMFGLAHNLADKITCKAIILSIHGGKDLDFQIVKFVGLEGKDHSALAIPPNRGFLLYRVQLNGLNDYFNTLKSKETNIYKPINYMHIEPYGSCQVFSVRDPNGVIWEFFEIQ